MSKSFSFSLEKVFEYRKNVENKRAVELSRAQSELKKKKDELNQLKIKKEQTIKESEDESKQSSKINLNQLKVSQDYILQLNEDITNQNKQVTKSGKSVKINLGKLLEASKDKKILENLKSKHFDEFKKMKKHIENKKDDEVSGRLALNKRKLESQ
jgi:flagellar FliJ protein